MPKERSPQVPTLTEIKVFCRQWRSMIGFNPGVKANTSDVREMLAMLEAQALKLDFYLEKLIHIESTADGAFRPTTYLKWLKENNHVPEFQRSEEHDEDDDGGDKFLPKLHNGRASTEKRQP